ncbi:Uncharacterised protein [Klebsiella pneumoniae]|nr:Uncharacterised protein [Klebsiella pneumoniae]
MHTEHTSLHGRKIIEGPEAVLCGHRIVISVTTFAGRR